MAAIIVETFGIHYLPREVLLHLERILRDGRMWRQLGVPRYKHDGGILGRGKQS